MTDQKFASAIEQVLKDIDQISAEELFGELMSFKDRACIAKSLESLSINYKQVLLSTNNSTKYEALSIKVGKPLKRCIYDKCNGKQVGSRWVQKLVPTKRTRSGDKRPDFSYSEIPNLTAA